MGNSASSQGSSTGTHDGDVGSSISEEEHDWPIEQAADKPDVQSLQEMRKPYIHIGKHFFLVQETCTTNMADNIDDVRTDQ